MINVTVEDIKRDLRIDHNDDDILIASLLDAAVSEVTSFLNVEVLPDASVVRSAIFLLVKSKYEMMEPDQIIKYRFVAEQLLMPHRVQLGV